MTRMWLHRVVRRPYQTLQPFLLAVLLLVSPSALAMDNDFTDGIAIDDVADAADSQLGDNVCADLLGRCTLRAAIQESNATADTQTLYLPAGFFDINISGTSLDTAASGDLDVTDSMILIGAGKELTVISTDGKFLGERLFHINDVAGLGLDVTMESLTITGGYVVNDNGGGILVEAIEGGGGGPHLAYDPDNETAVTLTLRHVLVAGNMADSNMNDPDGKPVGGSGGGLYSGAVLVAEDSEFIHNTAAANGGGFYAGATVTLTRSMINENLAEGGAGIFETGSHISTYTNCTIMHNAAIGGGGISARSQTSIQLLNCTVHGNTARDVGAGIHTNGTVNLVYSTVTGNLSGSDSPFGGAGLNSFGAGGFRLWSSLVADNAVSSTEVPVERNCGCTGSLCTPLVQFLSFGHNLEDLNTCFLDDPDDMPGVEPEIGPVDWTMPMAGVRPLRWLSAALDAGDPAMCPPTDQRGVARPLDGDGDHQPGCDVGAYEFDRSLFVFGDGFETGDITLWSAMSNQG